MSPLRQVAGLGGDVELDLRVLVVEVDRRRRRPGGGGRARWRSASRAPAPPSRWPVIDLVLVTTTSSDVLAEGGVQHQALGDVALRGRGGVGVDVGDRRRADVGLGERPLDRARAAAAGRVGLGDVVGVGGDAGAEHLGVDLGAAGPRVLLATRGPGRRRPRRARSRRGRCPTAGRRWSGRRPPRCLSSTAPSCCANAAIGSGWIAASVPPATTTSARPSRIWSRASEMRLVAGGAGGDRGVDARPGRRRTG